MINGEVSHWWHQIGAPSSRPSLDGDTRADVAIVGAGVVPWIIIVIYTLQPGSTSAAEVPGFVIGIIISLFVFFNTFAINQALQYHQVGGWKSYLRGERMYITLSLVAKSVLAWQVFSGALVPLFVE